MKPMKYLRIASDLHLESMSERYQIDYLKTYLPILDTDKDTILILAGDILNFNKPKSYTNLLNYLNDNFYKVLMIAGNHEYYDSDLHDGKYQFLDKYLKFNEYNFLDNEYIVINNIAFIGSTLWTNFNNNELETRAIVHYGLNDYNYIKYKGSRITPEIIYSINSKSINYIENQIDYFKNNLALNKVDKIIVISHHGPSERSIHSNYIDSGKVNYAFVSDYDEKIRYHKPNLWIHGHVHNSFDYAIANTRIITNPLGYSKARLENPYYDAKLIIDINNINPYADEISE